VENKSRVNVWTTLKDRVNESLEDEGKKLRITLLEIEQLSNTIEELSRIKSDYHPDHLASSEGSALIGQIQRNWNFVANIEDAIRKTNGQRLSLKKKERDLRALCANLEIEVKKYETLENRALSKYKKLEASKEMKAADEISTSFWLRTKNDST
jgi:flagellar export protein FliJ